MEGNKKRRIPFKEGMIAYLRRMEAESVGVEITYIETPAFERNMRAANIFAGDQSKISPEQVESALSTKGIVPAEDALVVLKTYSAAAYYLRTTDRTEEVIDACAIKQKIIMGGPDYGEGRERGPTNQSRAMNLLKEGGIFGAAGICATRWDVYDLLVPNKQDVKMGKGGLTNSQIGKMIGTLIKIGYFEVDTEKHGLSAPLKDGEVYTLPAWNERVSYYNPDTIIKK